jgi:hypothetical protein
MIRLLEILDPEEYQEQKREDPTLINTQKTEWFPQQPQSPDLSSDHQPQHVCS